MLGTAELAQMRAEHDRLLPDTCSIQRAAETRDAGGVSLTWSTIASGVACRLAAVTIGATSGQERMIAERLANEALFHLELPALTDVTAADRVVVTVAGQAARTFEVRWCSGRRSSEVGTGTLVCEVS